MPDGSLAASGSIALENRLVTVTVTPPPAGFTLYFDSMTATEALGRPFLYELRLISATCKGELSELIGSAMTVAIERADGGQRTFNGIVARMRFAGLEEGYFRYMVELRPWIWLLSRQQDCRIFQNRSIPDIVLAVFSEAGFTDLEDRRQNRAQYPLQEFCVQYRESSFDFVTRLMEEAGIYYFFTHQADRHVLVLADDPNSHTVPAGLGPVSFVAEERDYRRKDDHIWHWQTDLSLQSGGYALNDYNFTTPAADLSARARAPSGQPYGDLEVFDYPGDYDSGGDGQSHAAIRLQEHTAAREIAEAVGNVRLLGVGDSFTLRDFDDDSQNRAYVIRSAVTTLTMQEGWFRPGAERADTFVCRFEAIPGATPYRLPRLTRRPLVPGPQTARVVGAAGDEITTDEYGRIKVKFFWDRSDAHDDTASCWIRVSQAWAGMGWGSMVIPRVGQEVIVEFLEGNPDRPIVTGRVYNAEATVPYGLPGNKTRSTFKSNSSPGGGGFNEMRLEDQAGAEEIFIQAQKDMNTVVLNDQTATIGRDRTVTVHRNLATTVQTGNATYAVSTGTLTESVKSDMATTVVSGNQSVTVQSGNQSNLVSSGNQSNTVASGTQTVTVKGDQTTTVQAGNQMTTVLLGNQTNTVAAGNQVNIVACGNRTETITAGSLATSVGSNRSATISGSDKLDISGDRSVTVDKSHTLDVSKSISINAGDEITLTTGSASITMKKNGDITIEGNTITIKGSGIVHLKGQKILQN